MIKTSTTAPKYYKENKYMKIRNILFVLVLAFLIPLTTSAQKKKMWNKPLYDSYLYHFGFSFSLGYLDFSVDHSLNFAHSDTIYSVLGTAKPIFGANIVGNLKLNDHFDLRFIPGISFGQRNLQYIVSKPDTGFYYHDMKIESTFLEFPFYIKYRAIRKNNYRPYLIAGVKYAMDLATRKKIKEKEKPKIRLNRHDILAEAGFGVDFYLPYFKFSTQISFSYGLLNMVNYDYSIEDKENEMYANVFDRLGTKMVTVSIFFE